MPAPSPHSWLPRPFAGRLDEHVVDSPALAGNPLGDPSRRPVWVSVPPAYDASARLPVIYVIQGYTGTLDMWRGRSAFRSTAPELADALFARPDVPPALVVWVDAWTSYGGSQYLDSPGTGRYSTYLCEDVVRFVDATYRTVAEPAGRAISGKSSGGYGAMISGLRRPDVFGLLATHAGDALFETCYLDLFPAMARALREEYGGVYPAFWADLRSRVPFTRETDHTLVEPYGYAAAYSAEPDGTVVLPADLDTGEMRPAVWERWLAHDPVRVARTPTGRMALAASRGVWIDAGDSDEYHLDLGAEAFRRECVAAGLGDERLHFELFDGKHGAIEYRYPLAWEWLASRLSTG